MAQLLEEYEGAMKKAEALVFLVRDSELQLKQAEILRKLKARIRGFKYSARQAQNERDANELFHMQCGLNAMISFLIMWVDLKKEEYYSAWSKLIDAEEYISVAMRASESGSALGMFLDRVKETERVVFPGFRVYNSAGLIIRGGECSVCGMPFSECQHIESRVYWGSLCVRVDAEISKVDHVAIVDEPRDRRCIITKISTQDGFYQDTMTWKEVGKLETEDSNSTAMHIGGIIYSYHSVEID